MDESAADLLAPLKALIIDNSASMRELLRALLTGGGLHQCFEAADSREGLKKIREIKPDVVICDLEMKPDDGIVFAHHLRWDEESPNPYQPIVMIVGPSEHYRLTEVRDSGVSAILTKPVTAQNLLTHIVELVVHPRPFVRVGNYFGPDRRSRPRSSDAGGWLKGEI